MSEYEENPAYCGAVTTYEGERVVCWRNAEHDGAHQGPVGDADDDAYLYTWPRGPVTSE